MLRHAVGIAIAATALLAQAGAAQSPAGTWSFDWPVAVENGVVMQTAPVELVLEVKGDSVIGTWTMTRPDGTKGRTTALRGTFTGGKGQLTSDPITARANENGVITEVKLVHEWSITLEQNQLRADVIAKGEDGRPAREPLQLVGKRSAS